MSAIHSKATRVLFAVLALGFLTTACSSEMTGPSQGTGSNSSSPSVNRDSTRPSFGWRGGL